MNEIEKLAGLRVIDLCYKELRKTKWYNFKRQLQLRLIIWRTK